MKWSILIISMMLIRSALLCPNCYDLNREPGERLKIPYDCCGPCKVGFEILQIHYRYSFFYRCRQVAVKIKPSIPVIKTEPSTSVQTSSVNKAQLTTEPAYRIGNGIQYLNQQTEIQITPAIWIAIFGSLSSVIAVGVVVFVLVTRRSNRQQKLAPQPLTTCVSESPFHASDYSLLSSVPSGDNRDTEGNINHINTARW